MTRGAGTEKGWHKIFPGQLWANGSDYGVHPYCNICDISKCVRTCVLCLLIIWNSFTSKCKKYKITEHQILQSDTLANQFRFSFRASCPPPPLPLLPSFIWISWEAICCMRLVPNHRNHVSIKCFPAWDAFITVSTIWICKMYDDRGQARNLNLRCYFNAVVLLFFHTVLTASRWLPKKTT